MNQVVGRFAPTPSGFVHVGNVFCFLLAWLSAKKQGGRIVLRMEDLDIQRTSPQLALETMDDLNWLGLTWDEGPALCNNTGPYYQSQRSLIYDVFFTEHLQKGNIYPCFCSRTDVKLASAPHTSDGRMIYPGTCRTLDEIQRTKLSQTKKPAWRIKVPQKSIRFDDFLQGEYCQDLTTECGDFPVRRADGIYCYHMAVVIDDALMGVNEVVRARDLLSSTPQQIFLYELLGFPVPKFIHIPTVLDDKGNRLSKRDSSISLRELRMKYTQEEILGRLAKLANLQNEITPRSLNQLLDMFHWDSVGTEDIFLPPDLF